MGYYKKYQRGFTLIELLLVMVITTSLAGVLVINFRSSQTGLAARHRISSLVIADIRRVQSLALSGSNFNGQAVCGYGISHVDSASYIIYAGIREVGDSSCSTSNHPYQQNIDFVVGTTKIDSTKLEISGKQGGKFRDIFFESPQPTVYFNNIYKIDDLEEIDIVNTGQNCSSANCTTVTVYGSGNVDFAN